MSILVKRRPIKEINTQRELKKEILSFLFSSCGEGM